MERDFLNKKPNPVEQGLGEPLNQYLHKDLIFDTGDLNVKFNIVTVEDIIENQTFDTVDYTTRSNVYTDVGFVGDVVLKKEKRNDLSGLPVRRGTRLFIGS